MSKVAACGSCSRTHHLIPHYSQLPSGTEIITIHFIYSIPIHFVIRMALFFIGLWLVFTILILRSSAVGLRIRLRKNGFTLLLWRLRIFYYGN